MRYGSRDKPERKSGESDLWKAGSPSSASVGNYDRRTPEECAV